MKWARMCERRNIRMNSIKDLMPLVPGERDTFDRHSFYLMWKMEWWIYEQVSFVHMIVIYIYQKSPM